jgi:glycerol-3-phosphate acyltransferase PlsX
MNVPNRVKFASGMILAAEADGIALRLEGMRVIISGGQETRQVGVEEIKGIEEVKAAGRMLREADFAALDYRGFVEGDDIGAGTVDVVVTEGFTGNIALKTAEGTAKQIGAYLKSAMGSSLMSRIGYLFARGAFAQLKEKMDPRRSNGAVFLGLEGIVVKSHGGADALSFSGAIDVGYEVVRQQLLSQIGELIAQAQATLAQNSADLAVAADPTIELQARGAS